MKLQPKYCRYNPIQNMWQIIVDNHNLLKNGLTVKFFDTLRLIIYHMQKMIFEIPIHPINVRIKINLLWIIQT